MSKFIIVQMSDIHAGDMRFDADLLDIAVIEINAIKPDLLVVAGDLTAMGYKEEFEEAKRHIDEINCVNKVVIAGNHDCKNVGYEYFENIFGPRHADFSLKRGKEKVRIMAVDSNKPDLNDGEIGREKYGYIENGFKWRSSLRHLIQLNHFKERIFCSIFKR